MTTRTTGRTQKGHRRFRGCEDCLRRLVLSLGELKTGRREDEDLSDVFPVQLGYCYRGAKPPLR